MRKSLFRRKGVDRPIPLSTLITRHQDYIALEKLVENIVNRSKTFGENIVLISLWTCVITFARKGSVHTLLAVIKFIWKNIIYRHDESYETRLIEDNSIGDTWIEKVNSPDRDIRASKERKSLHNICDLSLAQTTDRCDHVTVSMDQIETLNLEIRHSVGDRKNYERAISRRSTRLRVVSGAKPNDIPMYVLYFYQSRSTEAI